MALTDNDIMPFGKHKGKKLSDVPHGYWLYMYDGKMLNKDYKEYAEEAVPSLRTLKEMANRNQDQERSR